MEFSSAHAFRRLQALALLQGFDGGTFARLHEEIFPAPDTAELLGPRIIDDTQIRAIVASYYQRHPEVALRARVLVLVKPLTTDELRRRGCAFLSALELATPGDFAPTSIGEVADAIQNALILARRRERVWAVNDTAPFFVVRDDVDEEYGELWQPPRPMLTRFADLIRAGDQAIRVLDKQVIGGITVHTYASNGEGVVLVTDGFRTRSLSGPSSDDLVRLELVTYAWRDAQHVAGRLVALGNALYDHPPIAPGAEVSADGTRYLVSMFGDIQATFEGDIQFTRVTPLAAGELDVAGDDEGWAFLDELGLAAAMSRW